MEMFFQATIQRLLGDLDTLLRPVPSLSHLERNLATRTVESLVSIVWAGIAS